MSINHPFPPAFVSAEAQLAEIFISEAINLGVSDTDAERLFKRLPLVVQSAPAIKFVVDQGWRYIFGKAFHFDGGKSRGFGIPHQAPYVTDLIRASLVAERALTIPQFSRSWWKHIDNRAKHFDAIVEMLTVTNVNSEHHLAYEQPGLGVASQQIDWLIKTKENGDFLLEVKNRPGQTAQEIERMETVSKAGDEPLTSDKPNTNFDALFKSTTSKFLPISDSPYIQGVMVFLGIKVPAAQFDEFFHNHLETHLHFVAFGKEDKESGIRVNLIAKSPEISDRVLSVLGWRNDADLIY